MRRVLLFTLIILQSYSLTGMANESAGIITCANWLKIAPIPFTSGLVAETDAANTLIITYDRGHYADTLLDIQSKLDKDTKVIVVISDNESFENDPKIFQKFEKLKNVTFVKAQDFQGNAWSRDWIPQKVIRSDGSIQYVNLRYYAIGNQERAPSNFAKNFELPHYESWVVGEMGNIMTDGKGKLFATEKILEDNVNARKKITQEMVIEELKKAFEAEEIHFIAQHPRDGGIGHIDLVAKYMGKIDGKETMLVSQSIRPDVKRTLDKTAEKFRSLGYDVVRIEEFEENIGNGAAGFVNSLILNKKVFMPTYSGGYSPPPPRYLLEQEEGVRLPNSQTQSVFAPSQRLLELEEKARRTYEKLGFTVVGIDSTTPIKGMGAVHCLTCTVQLEFH